MKFGVDTTENEAHHHKLNLNYAIKRYEYFFEVTRKTEIISYIRIMQEISSGVQPSESELADFVN